MQNQTTKVLSKLIVISLSLSLLVGGFLAKPANAQAGIGSWLAFGSETEGATPEAMLLSASAESIELRALMPGAVFGETTINGQSFLTLGGEGYVTTGEIGAPALPVFRQMVEVPLGAEVSIELLESNPKTFTMASLGLQGTIAPNQPSDPKCGDASPASAPSADLYGNSFYPAESLAIVDDYIMRGHRIVVVEVRPVRYNAVLGELEVSSEMNFRLKMSGSDIALTNSEADRLNSAPFNRLLQTNVLNYNQGRPVAIPNSPERYLIITADIFESGLSDLVALKTSQGFSVGVVNLTTVGGNTTTAIKNYIKAQYQGANPPDYVLLVGDYYPGNAADLTNYVMRTASGYRTDLQYFTMDNETEYVPDIFYGRFPVRTAANLSDMISKLLAYNAVAGDEAWVKKIEYLASNDGGYYQVAERTHNYVIEHYTLPLGYTGIFPNNPQPGGDKVYAITYSGTGANAVASMNDNRVMLIYSGHGATTFWDAPRVTQSDIRNMTGVAIPYVASHACITADFNTGESFSDTWVIEPTNGALTFFGSSDSTYWTEDEVIEKAIFDHLYADITLDTVPTVAEMTQYGLQAVDNTSTSLDNYYRETYHIFGDPSLEIVMKPKYPDFRINADPTTIKTCNNGTNQAALNLTSVNGYSSPVSLSASSVAGFTTTFGANPVTPPGSTTATITGSGTATTGTKKLTITGTSGSLVHTADLELTVFAPITGGTQLKTPADKAKDISPRPTFTWSEVTNTETYQLQVATDASFSKVVVDRSGIVGTNFTLTANLATDTQYYWRVYAENVCGKVIGTQVFSFRTSPGPGDCGAGTVKQQLFIEDFESGLDGWQNPGDLYKFTLSTVRAYSPTQAVLASVPGGQSDQRLISPVFNVPDTTEPVSLIFWHRWTFDSQSACNDGAILEASIDGGATWNQVAKSYLLTNAYNGTVRTGEYNPLSGRQAWCFGTDEWVRTVVQLSPYKGKSVQFRFRLGSGISGAAEGWYIDDVVVQTCVVTNQPNKLYLPTVFCGE